jgi:dienelactone hydrolase
MSKSRMRKLVGHGWALAPVTYALGTNQRNEVVVGLRLESNLQQVCGGRGHVRRRIRIPIAAALLPLLTGCSDHQSAKETAVHSAGAAGAISAGGSRARMTAGGSSVGGGDGAVGGRTGDTGPVAGGENPLGNNGGYGAVPDAGGASATGGQAGMPGNPTSYSGGASQQSTGSKSAGAGGVSIGGALPGGATNTGGGSKGGATNTGGAPNGGTTIGGAANTGGASRGGATSGGATNTGGGSKGGATTTGGAATGGATNTGGGSKGGATTTGGASTGGATTTGGTSTGGASTGGASAAGASPFMGDFPVSPNGITYATFQRTGETRSVLVYKPSSAGDNAPLFILYHGTGVDPYDFISSLGAEAVANQRGFVIAAPQAVANRMGGPADPDHWEAVEFATGWNLSDKTPESNDDIQLTRAIIGAAVRAYGINSKRVYTLGFSNGAFFAPFAAFLLPNEITGFAENSGGAIRCANRGEYDQQWVGQGLTCTALAQESNYPNCSGALKPAELPTGRVPRGYLVHYNDDLTVSVAWTCTLAAAIGSQATTTILTGQGHSIAPNLVSNAWTNLSGYSLP